MEAKLKFEHHFDAAHKLYNYKGACAHLHGHTWQVIVKAKGEINEEGFLIDFKEIESIIDSLDHSYINEKTELNPTAENIACLFLEMFEHQFPKIKFKVTIFESPNASITVKSKNY